MQQLGFCIGQGCNWAIADKVAALKKASAPWTKKEFQQFLGLANYYRCFVPQFSTLTAPLMDLLQVWGKGMKEVVWSEKAQTAFQCLKNALCANTILNTLLPNLPFALCTDASDVGLGAVVAQNTPKGEQPISFLSCKLTKAEKKDAVMKKEALAIQWAVEELKYYLWGQPFTVITEHAPLQ